MSHVLLLEVPGGTDFKILEEAVRLGHRVTFFTGDLGFYNRTQANLGLAEAVVAVGPAADARKRRSSGFRHGRRRHLAGHP